MSIQLISTSDALEWLATTVDDTTVFGAIVAAASDAVVQFLGFDPSNQTFNERYDGAGTDTLLLENAPITSLASVQLMHGAQVTQTLDTTCMIIEGSEIIWPGHRFPLGRRNVAVTYQAGWLSTDSQMQVIRLAAFQTAKAMYTGRGTDQNASSESYAGLISQGFWQTGQGSLPPQARSLLAPYRRMMKVVR